MWWWWWRKGLNDECGFKAKKVGIWQEHNMLYKGSCTFECQDCKSS